MNNYYEILDVEKDDLRIKTFDYYVERNKERNEIFEHALVIEAISVLSHPELRKIYDYFINIEEEYKFRSLIGYQFFSYYKHKYNNLECSCNYVIDSCLQEKVLTVALKIKEAWEKRTFQRAEEEVRLVLFSALREVFSLNLDFLKERAKYYDCFSSCYINIFITNFSVVFDIGCVSLGKERKANIAKTIDELSKLRIFDDWIDNKWKTYSLDKSFEKMLKGSSCCCVDGCFTQMYEEYQVKKRDAKKETEKLVIQLCSSKNFSGLSYFGEYCWKSVKFLEDFLSAMKNKPEDN